MLNKDFHLILGEIYRKFTKILTTINLATAVDLSGKMADFARQATAVPV